ncbi:SPW repeat protein [Mucilaginibacter sp. PAMB04168]|uniref:SPW repeat domain-containing protein n=1 Tax=Mucilaginibacter sp. PAMB04168 TaxID=3138567 RepID=UPI0031F5F516
MSGILFLASPWLFKYNNGTAAQWVIIIMGCLLLLMAIFTNYEAGVVKQISIPTHLTLDVYTGAFLIITPWLFGFSDSTRWPYLAFGLFEVFAGRLTKKFQDARTSFS